MPIFAAGDRNEKIQNTYFQALQTLEAENHLKGVQLYYRFVILGGIPVSKAVRARDLARAMGYFKKEIAEGRNSNRNALGILLIDRIIERYDRAERRLDLLREKHSSSVLLAFLRGELALSRGDETLAMRIFGTMRHLPNPRGFPALADYLLEQRGRGKTIDPAARRKFFMKLAYRRWDESDFDGAASVFRALMKEYPQDPEAPRALIDLLLQQDKTDEAVKILDGWKGVADEPLIPPLPLARIRYSQGQYEDALTLLGPLQEADPQDPYLRLLLAESLYQL
ncbi:tetratricopeptide repeat protein, partial [Candidatus Ozemobacteraceae bacterium]|nr:tetratricopeptide repeat protein [Candidatus Ozemobacteraceae bacterium]